MNKILVTLAFVVFGTLMMTAQIKVVAPNGDVGIGVDNPVVKLDVDGDARVRGEELIVGSGVGSADAHVEIGKNRANNGNAFFDLIGDRNDYPDFGGRLIRWSSGFTRFDHRGTKQLEFRARDAGRITMLTNSNERMRIEPGGDVGIGTTNATAKLSVNGTANKPGGGDWATFSDRRLKKNVSKFKGGLEEVLSINPVTYQYNGKGNITDTESVYVGVIAQELQEIAPYMVESVTVTEIIQEGEDETFVEYEGKSEDYLHIDATAIRYMLVNAVKEQQSQIEDQENQIATLTEKLEQLEAVVNELVGQGTTQDATLEGSTLLKQNKPNPFNSQTTISYSVANGAENASMQITDIQGRVIKSIPLDAVENGTLNLKVSDMASGTYTYSLVVDGQVMETQKMVIQK